jgi:hypothetical protein
MEQWHVQILKGPKKPSYDWLHAECRLKGKEDLIKVFQSNQVRYGLPVLVKTIPM